MVFWKTFNKGGNSVCKIYSTGISKRDLSAERDLKERSADEGREGGRATVEGSLKLHGDFRGIHSACILHPSHSKSRSQLTHSACPPPEREGWS